MQQEKRQLLDKVKVFAFSAKFFVSISILAFCVFTVSFRSISDLEKTWYFSTITFILGVYTSNFIPDKKANQNSNRKVLSGSGTNTPDIYSSLPPTPPHDSSLVIEAQKNNEPISITTNK